MKYTVYRAPHRSNTTGHARTCLASQNIVSILLLLVLFIYAAAQGDAFFAMLEKTSSTISTFKGQYGSLFMVLLVPAIIALIFSNYLFLKKPFVFFFGLIFCFSIAEAAIPLLSQLALPIRYMLMVTLISGGVCALPFSFRSLEFKQVIGLLLLALVFAHVFIDGTRSTSVSMLPIQAAVFLGLFVGVARVTDTVSIQKTLNAIVWAGIAATAIHLSSLILAPEPFLAGRFKSYLSLPTNFANGYVLLLVSILWMAMSSKKHFERLFYSGIFAIGAWLIYLSGTRNAMLSLVIASVILCFFWQRRHLIYLLCAGLLISVCFLIFSLGSDGGSEAGSRLTQISGEETRFVVWKRAISYIFNNPWWGYGLDVNMRDLDKTLPYWEKFDTHNAYLGLWLRLGFFGALAVILIYASSFLFGIRALTDSNIKSQFSCLAILPATLLVVIFVAGLFEENLSSKGNIQQILLGLNTALLIRLKRQINCGNPIVNRLNSLTTAGRGL